MVASFFREDRSIASGIIVELRIVYHIVCTSSHIYPYSEIVVYLRVGEYHMITCIVHSFVGAIVCLDIIHGVVHSI